MAFSAASLLLGLILPFLFEEEGGTMPPEWQEAPGCPSPPKGTLAFQSSSGGRSSVFLIETDGTGLWMLPIDTAPVGEPAWSPDGRRLAFQAQRPNWQVHTSAPNGEEVHTLSSSLGWSPTWSPDGHWIAFGRDDGIYKVPSEGGEAVRVASVGRGGRPSWSPDGTRILFHSPRNGSVDLFVTELSTGSVEQVTDNSGRDFHGVWSPDGRSLAFSSDRDGDLEIFLLSLDDSEILQMTENDSNEFMPAWSPDGGWLAFVSDRTGSSSIHLMQVDGSCVFQLRNTPREDLFPSWRPGGEGGHE